MILGIQGARNLGIPFCMRFRLLAFCYVLCLNIMPEPGFAEGLDDKIWAASLS